MRGEDEHKDEIKRSRSEEEEKGPKQGQGEGEGRYFILMLNFRGEKLHVPSAANCPIPAVPKRTVPVQEPCNGKTEFKAQGGHFGEREREREEDEEERRTEGRKEGRGRRKGGVFEINKDAALGALGVKGEGSSSTGFPRSPTFPRLGVKMAAYVPAWGVKDLSNDEVLYMFLRKLIRVMFEKWTTSLR
ncbi:hypothetical protein Q5P01_003743 [Channa striata]|uniref:Uncharacterized protein n=1 Tax=Channa striata TaxID=64152 RepID=A0AA88T0L5_CHASR|nr:hypothetical protein Q5P01_003743 [Channa striata]